MANLRGPVLEVNVAVDKLAAALSGVKGMAGVLDDVRFTKDVRRTVLNRARGKFYELLDEAAERSALGEGIRTKTIGSMGSPGEPLGRLHHIYEWGHQGEQVWRLIRVVFPQLSPSAKPGTWVSSARIDYKESTAPVPYRGGKLHGQPTHHVFREKARVMEELAGAATAPRYRPALAWWDFSLNHLVRSKRPVFVTYSKTQGKFAEFFNEFWGSGLGEKLAVEPVGVAINNYIRTNYARQINRMVLARQNIPRVAASGSEPFREQVGKMALGGIYTIKGRPFTAADVHGIIQTRDVMTKTEVNKAVAGLIREMKKLTIKFVEG